MNQHLKRLEKSLGVKKIPFHGFRHTHASLLLANDVLIQYISERLGHENVNITIDVYAHLINEKRDDEEKKATSFLDNL
ncbi:tyrosine-type recombinase/integrase [Fructobacillus fructosus]|uniref:tyrosine-type recombinase/integrase n=1 Tax=Fructobacillus fructosus TaxID=1631 RepID=UPI001658BCD6|nr:tyrosine-type recombinase/integrase [Fructobacillus fructosus]MBD9365096.1 tyrosine-type recombinase/integrase [Leuconostoc mesenteroides]